MCFSNRRFASASFWCIPLALVIACSGGSSGGEPASPDAGTSKTPDGGESGPTLPTGDLGKNCGAGCAGSKICTVSDDACESGHCLFDGRTAPSSAYCTADCSKAACPSGFVCEDVPFELARACVRDTNVSANPGSPRIKGTVHLKGAAPLSDDDTASSFDVTYAIDGVPAPSLQHPCGRAYVTTASRTKGFQIYVRACDESKRGEVLGRLVLEVPFKTGTFTASDGDTIYPSLTVSIGPNGGSTVAHYGTNRDTPGATLAVTTLEGVEDAATPWKVGKMTLETGGTLAKETACTGACEAAASTLDVAVSLELVAVASN